MKIFISTAPSDQFKTGDVDYAHAITKTLNASGLNAFHIKDKTLSAEQIIEEVLSQRSKNESTIFHLIMNGDDTFKVTTGGTIKPEHLNTLSIEGVKIVITCLEYAKWSISSQPQVIAHWDEYFLHAEKICFVDVNDKNTALTRSQVLNEYDMFEKIEIVPIPTTLEKLKFEELTPLADRERNFLCFGIIRPFKGIEKFALPLAKELKEKQSIRKVLIVGSIPTYKTNFNLIADMFTQAYGEKEPNGKVNTIITNIIGSENIGDSDKSRRLMEFYDLELKYREPNINVEFHFNVEEEDLAPLFNRCSYALNFNFKGISPHFSGITNSLMAHMKNYGLDLYLTPDFFREGGDYSALAKLFKIEGGYPEDRPLSEEESHIIADEILADVEQLESNLNWPQEVSLLVKRLNQDNPMDILSVTALYKAIYLKITCDFTLLQHYFSERVSQSIAAKYKNLICSLKEFKLCDPTSEQFYSVVQLVMQNIDVLRLSIEVAIHSIDAKDKNSIRKILFERFIESCFKDISSMRNQEKIIKGVLANQEWLHDLASRTVAHQIGFIKLPIISYGGQVYNMERSDEGDAASMPFIKMPSLELRLHIYNDPGQEFLGQYLHAHGFDLYSKVNPKGMVVDQRFDLYENPLEKETKQRLDRFGVDVPEFRSEAESLVRSSHRVGMDLDKPLHTKRLHARHTYRFYGDQKSGHKLVLFSPKTKTFTAIARLPIMAEGDSVRLHLSEEPHFVLSAQGTHTFCLTLRRPGVNPNNDFKPSFLLVDSSDPDLSELDSTGVAIKKPASSIAVEELSTILHAFLENLRNEIEYLDKLQSLPVNKVNEYALANLLNTLLKISKVNAELDPILSIQQVMQKRYKPFLVTYMTLKKSLADPTVFLPLFQRELQRNIATLFEACYQESFDVENYNHLEFLNSVSSVIPSIAIKDISISGSRYFCG